jgi:hypothetical protein
VDRAHSTEGVTGAVLGITSATDAALANPALAGDTMVVAPESQPLPPADPDAAGTVTANGAGPAVVSRSARDAGLARPPTPRRDQLVGARIPRRITFRVLLFLVVLLGLAYAGFATVHWYVNSSYFVGLNHGQVVIYQGRPGGFVGIEPKIVHRTQVTSAQVPSYRIPDLRRGVQEPSYQAANSYVTELRQSVCSLQQPPAYCSTSTPTTPPGFTPATSVPAAPPATSAFPGPGPLRNTNGREAV